MFEKQSIDEQQQCANKSTDVAEKILFHQSSPLVYDNACFSRKSFESTYSSPLEFTDMTSFERLLAEEKYNLQFFRSFHSPAMPIENGEEFSTSTFVTHSSNIMLNFSSNAHTTIPKQHRAEEQTRAAHNFISQLNAYINGASANPFEESIEEIDYEIQYEKLDGHTKMPLPPKVAEVDYKTAQSLEFISRIQSNNSHRSETNDSIDISLQLADSVHFRSLSNLNRHSDLLTLYGEEDVEEHRKCIQMYKKSEQPTQIGSLSKNESNQHIFPVANMNAWYRRTKKGGTNKGTDIKQSTIGCCGRGGKKSTIEDAGNIAKSNKMDKAKEHFHMNAKSNFGRDWPSTMTALKDPHVTGAVFTTKDDVATLSSEHIQPDIEANDSLSITTELSVNEYKQLNTMKSPATGEVYPSSESSISKQKSTADGNNKTSLLPLHSRCLVRFEYADQEKHLVEGAEILRSTYRISRLHTYRMIRERLALVNLIDVDLIALFKTILKSFP